MGDIAREKLLAELRKLKRDLQREGVTHVTLADLGNVLGHAYHRTDAKALWSVYEKMTSARWRPLWMRCWPPMIAQCLSGLWGDLLTGSSAGFRSIVKGLDARSACFVIWTLQQDSSY